MDGGTSWATVHGVAELDTTERLRFRFFGKPLGVLSKGCAKRRPWEVKDCASPAAGELYQECTFAVTLQAVVQGRSLMTCEAASV